MMVDRSAARWSDGRPAGASYTARMPATTTIVVPCFNEERRLDLEALQALGQTPAWRLLLVDDGSTDGTPALLRALADGADSIDVVSLPTNSGKAEAVRHGLRHAIAGGASIVSYYDADLSTPPDELHRLVEKLAARDDLHVVMAARVALLGRDIERRAHRHYLGRVFATFASLSLDLPVYDTQCGAKVLRVTPTLEAALARPFRSRWAFDVELLGRLLYPGPGLEPVPRGAIVEIPLRVWHDTAGSKLGPTAMGKAALELALIARETRRSATFRDRGD